MPPANTYAGFSNLACCSQPCSYQSACSAHRLCLLCLVMTTFCNMISKEAVIDMPQTFSMSS